MKGKLLILPLLMVSVGVAVVVYKELKEFSENTYTGHALDTLAEGDSFDIKVNKINAHSITDDPLMLERMKEIRRRNGLYV